MTDEIKRLFQDTIEKQKNPYCGNERNAGTYEAAFLYNTLEALEALILMDEKEKVQN